MEQNELTKPLAKALAWIDATRPLIEALVMTHPDHAALRNEWHAQLPQQVEDAVDTAPFAVDAYREKLMETLGDISQWLDGLASRTGEAPNPPTS